MDLKDSVKTLGDAKHTITHISKKHPLLRWIPRRVTTHGCQDLVTTQLAIKENVITPMVLVVSLAFIQQSEARIKFSSHMDAKVCRHSDAYQGLRHHSNRCQLHNNRANG